MNYKIVICKLIIFLGLILFVGNFNISFAQVKGFQDLGLNSTVLKGKVEINGDILSVNNKEILLDTSNRIKHLNLTLSGDDLLIDYTLKQTIEKEYYSISFKALVNDEEFEPMENEWQKKGEKEIEYPTAKGGDTLKQIVWIGMGKKLEDFVDQDFQLTFNNQFYGFPEQFKKNCCEGDNCPIPIPDFKFNKQVPYYSILGLGLISLGVGQIWDAESDRIYETYKATLVEEDSRELYREANSKHQYYLVATGVGLAIIAADAYFGLSKYFSYKKKLRNYKVNCIEKSDQFISLKVGPNLQVIAIDSQPINYSLGLNIAFKF